MGSSSEYLDHHSVLSFNFKLWSDNVYWNTLSLLSPWLSLQWTTTRKNSEQSKDQERVRKMKKKNTRIIVVAMHFSSRFALKQAKHWNKYNINIVKNAVVNHRGS